MHLDRALAQLSEIHAQVLQGSVYRGYSARASGVTAGIALVGAVAQDRVLPAAGAEGFALYWSTLAVACAMVAALDPFLWRSTRTESSRRTFTVVLQLLPALVVGAALPWLLLRSVPSAVPMLPGLWAIVFGLGILASRPYLPRAIGWGMAAVLALYLAINAAYLGALGLDRMASGKLVAADLARAGFGQLGQGIVSLAIFLSAAGFVNATLLQLPRSYFAMAEDGALPRAFLAVRRGAQTQDAALALVGVTMLVPALFLGSFEKLLQYVMFTDALTLVTVASCLFVLRRRRIGEEEGEPFRTPGYPWLPGLFVAVLAAVALRVLWQETGLALAGLGILAAGFPLFFGLRRLATRPGGAPGPS